MREAWEDSDHIDYCAWRKGKDVDLKINSIFSKEQLFRLKTYVRIPSKIAVVWSGLRQISHPRRQLEKRPKQKKNARKANHLVSCQLTSIERVPRISNVYRCSLEMSLTSLKVLTTSGCPSHQDPTQSNALIFSHSLLQLVQFQKVALPRGWTCHFSNVSTLTTSKFDMKLHERACVQC